MLNSQLMVNGQSIFNNLSYNGQPMHPMHKFDDTIPSRQTPSEVPRSRWNPYEDNGGTAVAVALKDFVVFAADTRMSRGYSILSRKASKVYQLTDKTYMMASGQRCDVEYLHNKLKADIIMYEFNHRCKPSTEALAELVSRTLYSHRFRPLYSFTIVVGLTKDGRGVTYAYDAVGSFEPSPCSVVGSGAMLTLPVLDAFVKEESRNPSDRTLDLTLEQCQKLCETAIKGATERDIHTGDDLELFVLQAGAGPAKKKVMTGRRD